MKLLVVNKDDLKHNINIIKKIAGNNEIKSNYNEEIKNDSVKNIESMDNIKNIENQNNIENVKDIDIIKNAENTEKNNDKSVTIIGVVKGNGYGLGLLEYSQFLLDNGINLLAVSTVEEAILLRKNQENANILMLSSISTQKELELLIENDIILSIGSFNAGEMADKIAVNLNKKINVNLKIDTGFGRYGFCYDKKLEMLEAINKWKNITIVGTFSHCSLAFYKKDKYSEKQFDRFMQCVNFLKDNKIDTGMLHFCNSSAFLKYPQMRLDAVRVGSAFLGRLSIPNKYHLKKIGFLTSNIGEIKLLPKGHNIGYSNSYTTKKETTIAVIPVGYADGFNVGIQKDMFRKRDKIRYIVRDIKDLFKKQQLFVKINNEKCEVLGRVGMYNLIVNITNKNVSINDEVIIQVNPIYIDNRITREYQ